MTESENHDHEHRSIQPPLLGGVAGSLHDANELEPADVEPPPRITMRWRTEFIQGMRRPGDDFLIRDVHAVFSSEGAVLMI